MGTVFRTAQGFRKDSRRRREETVSDGTAGRAPQLTLTSDQVTPPRHRASALSRMEFLVLDVVYIAGILALIALVALIGKAVEKL
ncbi:hypothetical protein BH11ACT3_BH11ACT3_18810 [soil metagenome]